MANYTTNYKLCKPELQDAFSLNNHLNANWEKIDNALSAKADDSIIVGSSYQDVAFTPVEGKYRNYSSGEEQGATGYNYSGFIPCVAGDKFKVTTTFAYNASVAVYYNSQREYVNYYNKASGVATATDEEVIIPDGVSFVIFNNHGGVFTIKKLSANTIPISEALNRKQNTLTNGSVQENHLADNAITVTKLADETKKYIHSPKQILEGKTLYVAGDSVAQGQGSGEYAFGEFLSDRNNMTLVKDAIGGTTLMPYDNQKAPSIMERVLKMTGSYDYIIIEGGFNDVFHNHPLGEVKMKYRDDYPTVQTFDYDGKYDTATIIGAVETICWFLVTNHFEAKKLFVLGHKKIGSFAVKQNEVWAGIISALEKWGIPYVNLKNETNLCAFNTTVANANFSKGDGTHPNRAAYEKYYVPLIESKLAML